MITPHDHDPSRSRAYHRIFPDRFPSLRIQLDQTQVFLFLQNRPSIGVEIGCYDHIGKDRGNDSRKTLIEGSVDDNHATKRSLGIGFIGQLPCLT